MVDRDDGDDPRVGRVLDGRYRVVAGLGTGGMGTVYRGERVKLGREVAIKFLHTWAVGEASFIKRFELEARAMAKLQHPNCASVIDFGVEGHEPYVVMDLVGGVSLRQLVDDAGALPVPRALEIARQVLAGLAHAHRHGIVHRDIKPENIMVEATEVGDAVRVLDFGLAKMNAGGDGNLTGGLVVGTPSYMSPEQSRGEPVDAKADIYAVGVVLFEMLTGDRPFIGDDAGDTMRKHREVTPPRLADRRPGGGFAEELEAVVARALAKAPAERYTAAELAVALEALVGGSRALSVPPVKETIVLDAVDVIPMTGTVSAVAPAPEAEAVADAVAEAPVAVTRPVAGAGASAWLAKARERRWLVAASGIGVVAAIVVIVVVAAGGGGESAAGGAVEAREPEEIEMVDEGPAAPPELAGLRAKVRGAATPQAVVTALSRLGAQHPRNAEIPFLLGQIYFERLWVDDGLEQFRKAIRLDPGRREDPALIRAALNGLGNDGHHAKVRRFLAKDIGPPAVPYLQGVVDGNWRKEVKDRAAATLRDLGG